MRVFLFCIDALEYDFVIERNFPNIKQLKAVKVHIPLNCMTETEQGLITPFSPVMWKQILTGRQHSESIKPKRYNNEILNWLLRRIIIRKLYRFVIKRRIFRRGLPLRMGFERKDILDGVESLLTFAENPIILQNPVLSEVKWSGTEDSLDLVQLMKMFTDIFEEERLEIFERIDDDWDLFLFYTKLLDHCGHCCGEMMNK